MSQSEFEKIASILTSAGVPFEVIEHEPVRTSAEAAAVRGQRLSIGVKALLVKFSRKGKVFFCIADIPADRRLDWKKMRKVLQASEARFASEAEVAGQTGCEPGGVPPLGFARQLAILADPKIFEQQESEFNAGLKTRSIHLASAGLKKVFDSIGVAYFDLVE
ncbi:hypothetical protein HY995_03305 [Candidatus Micrarchaeota archaeon]|nr:hypothetical protein [Candidatus Micrarchaeota archaeon]